jgi:hypothetical protein
MAWLVPVLADRARHAESGFYPVAKTNNPGSRSNKFCLAVLVWEKGWRIKEGDHCQPSVN